MAQSVSSLFWEWLQADSEVKWRNSVFQASALSKPQAIYLDKLRETRGFCSEPSDQISIMSSTSSPPSCMCLPALWFTEMELSSPSLSEQFVGAYAIQTFLENPPEEDRRLITRCARTLWRAYSWCEFSISSKAGFTKGIFFSFSAKTQTLYFHFFTASHNVMWVPLSPGWQTWGQAAFLDDWAPAPASPRNHTLR